MNDPIHEARSLLESNGYVVLREKSYRQAQERQRVADARREWAERDRDDTLAWAREKLLTEERRLRDRCTFLYGAARAHGATLEELRGGYDSATPAPPLPSESPRKADER